LQTLLKILYQILNSTPKKHPDYALVKSALSVAQNILEDVNEETRRFENHHKMNELSRIIDMDGAQVKTKQKEKKKALCIFFLIFLVAESPKP
jgi:2-polyprenyl-3-methyl-5-hydroxy-6-metoxy-1,4-benzoquinol methylase